MNVGEKVAYLRGLMEGSGLSFGEKEKKIVDAAMDVLTSVAARFTEIDADVSELYGGFKTMCDDLDDMAEDIDCLFGLQEGGVFGEERVEGALYDVVCPKCREKICIDEEILQQGDINCPGCGERLEFDVSCDCEDCGKKENGE
ncbi:MAG: hypothetical protein FWE66_00595 [Oscillospiraceae bacterium]|nr:hypothetical protein [Oscillospiraceae bacterium]